MASKHKLLPLAILLLGLILSSQGQDEEVISAVKNIFLSKTFNASEVEEILKSARESFLYLKGVEKMLEAHQKLNFAKNYANFLLQLFKQLRTKELDVSGLFSKENFFLKGYIKNSTVENLNATEVQVAVENFQIAAEQLLIPYYNSSSELHNVEEVLNLGNSSFEAFLKEKLRTDYSEIGYFLLEVFATLIGLSWGIISTVIHIVDNVGGE